MFAREMAKRGHDVTLYVPGGDSAWGQVKIRPIRELHEIDSSFDVAYAWNEPDLLRSVRAKMRMVNQQLNDFTYCHDGFDEAVDIYTSPSVPHMEFIAPQTANPKKWRVLPNGCDPTQYTGAKVPGRIIYASSPDRGLHNLLEVWPRIKAAVPNAKLKIFYELASWINTFLSGPEHHMPHGRFEPGLTETGYRARYINLALERYGWMDIELVGSVSREEIAREMSQAECLAYPCDPIRWTEGFSVTTMEGCASGAVPVITSADAMGHIYRELPTVIPHPIRFRDSDRLQEFADRVIRVMNEPEFRAEAVAAGKSIAAQHTWELLGDDLEEIIRG
jgi:glycosyltransferase involved in cell wall biosynthesis